MEEPYLTGDEYIMYLRKSRADSPHESVEEVLEKHETILQELAARDLGGRIPEHCIYREVVSGETISERPEMLNVLAQIENPKLKAVLVVDPQRLSRGDLEDCGKVVNAFRYSNTEVITTLMSYDLRNKMQRKFFEQELMRGNDFLEYTKEILLRGRIAAVKRGCYIGNIPPFGFNKIIDGDGDSTLEANEYAPAVLMAFEMYLGGTSYLEIARHFDSLGIKPCRSEVWEKSSIRAMLKNRHYIGLVYFGRYRTEKSVENGEIVERSVRQAEGHRAAGDVRGRAREDGQQPAPQAGLSAEKPACRVDLVQQMWKGNGAAPLSARGHAHRMSEPQRMQRELREATGGRRGRGLRAGD